MSATNVNKNRLGIIIGGTGLVGGTIVNYFKDKCPEKINILAPNSKKLSIRVPEDIRSYLATHKPDFIINSAIANINANEQLCYDVNFLGPIILARKAIELGIPYIHVSTAATLELGKNIREEQKKDFAPWLSNYARSKLMAEKALAQLHSNEGLDYSVVRLAAVYGNHDHKIQGIHRMLFSIADESMPVMFTKRGVLQSYSNCRKLPYFIHHMIDRRDEFSAGDYNFVDEEPVELVDLIMKIRSYLNLSTPKNICIPYPVAETGRKSVQVILRLLSKFGLKAELPPELIFLKQFYITQTLNSERYRNSSFIDPLPKETIYSRLPEMISYYLNRWSHQNLITTFDEKAKVDRSFARTFRREPEMLIDSFFEEGSDYRTK